jgi:ribosomal protein S18 acetylase RimI-like enzyme
MGSSCQGRNLFRSPVNRMRPRCNAGTLTQVAISIDDLELAAVPGWRACEEHRLGDWLLRAADGFTGRANSALAAGDPGMPLATAIGKVRGWYTERGRPAMIAIAYPTGQPAASALDRLLAGSGWTARADAATMMTAETSAVAASGRADRPAVEMDAKPDAAWLGRYHYRGGTLPPVALALLTSAPWQEFGSVRFGDETIAIGRVAGAGDWAGLTAIEVAPEHRRQGLAVAITAALAGRAASCGFPNLYLQVTDDNSAARTLYRRLGFADHHGYHYRVEPVQPT